MDRETYYEIFSIRCPRCLTWSIDEADYCHRCGRYIRCSLPQDEIRDAASKLIQSIEDAVKDFFKIMGE
jgi:hypothetical protein